VIVLVKKKFADFHQTLTGRVLINAGWRTAAMPITMGLGVIQTGFLARIIGLEGFGILGLFIAVTELLSGLLNVSSAETLITFASKSLAKDDKHAVVGIIVYCYVFDFLTSCVAYGILILFPRKITDLFNIPSQYEQLLIIYALTVVLRSTFWDSDALLRLINKFSWLFYQGIIISVVRTSSLAVFIWSDVGLTEVVWLYVAIFALDSISLGFLGLIALDQMGIHRSLVVQSGLRVSKNVWRFQLMVYGRGIVKSMNRYIDILLIGYLTNPTNVGLYRVAKQLTNLYKTPMQGLASSLYPEFSRLWFAKNIKAMRRLAYRFTLAFTVIGLVAIILLSIFVDDLILLILGTEFLPARDAAFILFFSASLVVISIPLYTLPAAVGRAHPALYAVSYALVIQMVLIWLLVPLFGAVGAAWANVAYVVVWIAALLPAINNVLRHTPDKVYIYGNQETR